MEEEAQTDPAESSAQSLGASARAAALWSMGFTLFRDVAQFGVMLVLVRLLSPSDYGTGAFAQTVIGFAATISFVTFSTHALQIRNPADVDWQAHFTAATVLDATVICFVLVAAWGLSLTGKYHEAALPVAALALIFVVEIPATLRLCMLQSAHDWKRFRLLVMTGTLLALGTALVVALMGGRVWALIVQPPLFGLPAAIDLFAGAHFKPNWSWSWARYRETAFFGLNRVSSGLLVKGQLAVEQFMLAGTFNFALLGIFTRAEGLSTLVAGRIGSVAILTLYPVITRAACGSERFRRLSGLVLRGVCWTTVPAAMLLAITAPDMVHLLYGARWDGVVPLLPLAVLEIGLGGLITAMTSLLLANGNTRTCLMVETGFNAVGILLALVIVPQGPVFYLAALGVQGAVTLVVAGFLLMRRNAIDKVGLKKAFLPTLVATLIAATAAIGIQHFVLSTPGLIVHLAIVVPLFVVLYFFVLRILFHGALLELLDVVPGGGWARRLLRLHGSIPREEI